MSLPLPGRLAREVPFSISLYGVEGAALMFAVALYKKAERPLPLFLTQPAGVLFLTAVVLLVASGAVLADAIHRSPSSTRNGLRLLLATNLVTLPVLLVTAEVALRLFSWHAPGGLILMDAFLLPRRWDEVVASNRKSLREASIQESQIGTYLVYDDLLGWTVGRNRSSANGLYFSGPEGVRSPRPGTSFAARQPPLRVALIGDSYTFGLEVRYEDAWGARLERELGEDVQVLNFGVDGFGVDQAYLRYQRDVRSWRPDVVVFGMAHHDFERTMGLYCFLTFPKSALPFSKPRFTWDGHRLALLNAPTLPPDAVFARSSIEELPFIEYDRGYVPDEWQRRYWQKSYIARLLFRRYPRPAANPLTSDEALASVNREILRAFLRSAAADGSDPLLVYLPSRADLTPPPEWRATGESPAKSVLRRAGLAHLDMTPCVARLPVADRFLRIHYSPLANAAIAQCLGGVLAERLRARRSEPAQPQGSARLTPPAPGAHKPLTVAPGGA